MGLPLQFKIKMMRTEKTCLVCQVSSESMPLTKFYYRDFEFFICSQHMPVIIHNPQELVGKLPDAEHLKQG